ncbi:MAG: glycosyltransferase family 4 protein [Alphaproteobacteria bacterium]|nr:glycosyltransferase family 4 protein [Alphaproteobacteria bacterium]
MILIVLPKNNPLDFTNPKPVVSAMIPYAVYSKFAEDICIFTPQTEHNDKIKSKILPKANYNKHCLTEIQQLLNEGIDVDIVEVHQDVRLAGLIAKKFPQIKVSVVKHSNYFINRFKENFSLIRLYYYRQYIRYLHSTYCVSNYVRDVLVSGYPKIKNKIWTIYNTYGHMLDSIKNATAVKKKKQIIFAGKPVSHKGIVEFISSLPLVLNQHKDYAAVIIGAFFSSKEKYANTMVQLLESNEVKELIAAKRILFLKNLKPSEVFANMQESSIAVIPTKTNEPFGLVCLEAHLSKCAVISSGRGGLREISGNHAIYLKDVSAKDIADSIDYLIKNPNILENLSVEGYEYAYNKFAPQNLVAILDAKREKIINEH